MPLFVWFSCEDRIQLLAVVDERAVQNDVFSYGAQLLLTGTDAVARYRTYTKSFSFGSYLTNLDLDKKTIVEYADRALEVLGYYVPIVAFSLLLVTPLSVYLLIYFICSRVQPVRLHFLFPVRKKVYVPENTAGGFAFLKPSPPVLRTLRHFPGQHMEYPVSVFFPHIHIPAGCGV
jgi:hypothetical protein